MQSAQHTFNDLFAQLGLPSDEVSIDLFLATHAPLPEAVPLTQAPFWSPSQRAFLREEILGDADWAELVDALNQRLRA